MKISITTLQSWNPFHSIVWSMLDTPVSKGEVRRAIRNNNLRSTPIIDGLATRGQHIARIAYLVVNKDNNPISLDVGVPSLGYMPDWIIYDGNHRLAAAFFNNDAHIDAEVSGDVEYAKELLGVDI